MVATAQRYTDEHPDVGISWQVRSLKDFGEFPIERLTEDFDLLIIDHPFAGYAAGHPVLVPLDEHIPADFLADQAANSVGKSYESYCYDGHLWALPVDAATPVSGYRPDLMARHGVEPPTTWEELLELARQGYVAVPGTAVDAIMAFYMLCLALNDDLFRAPDRVVGDDTGVAALDLFRELIDAAGSENFTRNPIRGDHLAYCPFAYGYSNYGRLDYTSRPLKFGGLVALGGAPLRSVLGGTGLAISNRCEHVDVAVDYAKSVASPDCQRGLYTISGGQPAHRQAWLDHDLNVLTNDFFLDTLPTLDAAYLRPRYAGYIPFQEESGALIHSYLGGHGSARDTLDVINKLFRMSQSDV
jgi:multiple sugar transport system substrate-binding protein